MFLDLHGTKSKTYIIGQVHTGIIVDQEECLLESIYSILYWDYEWCISLWGEEDGERG